MPGSSPATQRLGGEIFISLLEALKKEMTWFSALAALCSQQPCRLPSESWLLPYAHVSAQLLLWNTFPLVQVSCCSFPLHITASPFSLKATLTFNALQVDLFGQRRGLVVPLSLTKRAENGVKQHETLVCLLSQHHLVSAGMPLQKRQHAA